MQNADTPERALALLDQAVLMRLDPDPAVAMPFGTETDEPLTVGPNDVNPEVYWHILGVLEHAYCNLDAMGWTTQTCSPSGAACPTPHVAFAHLQTALDCALRRFSYDAAGVQMLDQLLDSHEFMLVHKCLASIVRRGANASCSSSASPKR